MRSLKHIRNEEGMALIIALVMLVTLTIVGMSALMTSRVDIMIAGNERFAQEALQIADGGIEQVFLDLTTDFKADKNWANSNFSTISNGTASIEDLGTTTYGNFDNVDTQFGDPFAASPTFGNSVDVYGGTQTLGDGTYRVLLLRESGNNDEVYVRSYAVHKTGARKIIQLHLRIDFIDSWRNSVFAGRGSGANVITGNVKIAGPLHILGTGDVDTAFAVKGNTKFLNGYDGLATDLYNVLPEIYQDADGNDDLEAVLRVKRGQVDVLSGSPTFGEFGAQVAQDNGSDYKGELAGILLNDGWEGGSPPSNLHADEVVAIDGYDLGDKIQMPTFSDDYDPDEQKNRLGQTCEEVGIYGNCGDWSYNDYITTMSTELNGIDKLGAPPGGGTCILDQGVTDSFQYPDDYDGVTCNDPNGCIKWVKDADGSLGNPNLIIDGRIEVKDCTELKIGTNNNGITYQGKGLLYNNSDISFDSDLTMVSAPGQTRDFTTDDLLGVLTQSDMFIHVGGASPITIMGAFFASDRIISDKPNTVVGTIASNTFCLAGLSGADCAVVGGGNPFSIYYVKQLSEEIGGVGMLKSRTVFTFKEYDWDQIF